MKCPKCGADNSTGLTFCKRCWTFFADPARAKPEAPESGPTVESEPHGPERQAAKRKGPLFGVGYVDEPDPVSNPDPLGSRLDAPGIVVTQSESRYPSPVPNSGVCGRIPVEQASARSSLALTFGLLSIVLFCLTWMSVPIDLVAIVLGGTELHDIGEGQSPAIGRSRALVGMVLGGISLVFKCFLLLMFYL